MAGRRSAAPWGWLALVALALAACGTATESSPTLQIGSPAGGGDAELAAPETVGGDAGGLAGDLGTVDAGAPIGDAGAPADTHPNTDAAMPADAAAAGDAVVAADGAVVQDSAGPADGSSGADAPAPPDASPDAAVALDSAVVVDAVPPGDSGPAPDAGPPALACGNGLCQGPTETALTCPSDCATGWQACANGACQAAALACSKAVACSAATACAANCKDLGCVSACTSGLDWAVMTALLVPLASCAQLHGCLAAAPPGPGAGPSTCKNGACDGGETHLTCPSDCPFPVSASELCQTQSAAKASRPAQRARAAWTPPCAGTSRSTKSACRTTRRARR
ncbi:MAG: hypothetical protein HY902_13450 [Deltaproteobacteria bacterium]|nr:hypothetical protein [Deltaproteobacteria bacterium]